MSKYLKLIIFYTVFSSFAVFSFSANAQNSDQNQAEEEEEEEEEAIKTITTPNLVPAAELSGIESNAIVNFLRNPNRGTLSIEAASIITNSGISASARNAIGSSGVASAEIISLGSSNINLLASKLTGSAAQQATQFKTIVNVVDAYSNTTDTSLVGRRAIAPTADISTIVTSTINSVTTEHLDTLSNLDVSHMKTFATGGIKYIDNFTTSVDVTHAFLSEDFANSEKTFDADSTDFTHK